MGGLACGEVSLLAWRILATGADAFATIEDEAAAECMRLLAQEVMPRFRQHVGAQQAAE